MVHSPAIAWGHARKLCVGGVWESWDEGTLQQGWFRLQTSIAIPFRTLHRLPRASNSYHNSHHLWPEVTLSERLAILSKHIYLQYITIDFTGSWEEHRIPLFGTSHSQHHHWPWWCYPSSCQVPRFIVIFHIPRGKRGTLKTAIVDDRILSAPRPSIALASHVQIPWSMPFSSR
jgi:hypothetical protein